MEREIVYQRCNRCINTIADEIYMIIYTTELAIGIFLLLLGIGFVTLLERYILGYSISRVSPNKVGIGGLIQSIIDGLTSRNIKMVSGYNVELRSIGVVLLFISEYGILIILS